MANIKLTTKKLREMRAVACGELLVDFISTNRPVHARREFVKRFKSQFGYRVMGPNKNLTEEALEKIEDHQFYIKELLDDFLCGEDLSQSLILAQYVDEYNLVMQNFSLVDVYHFMPRSALSVKKSELFDGSHFTGQEEAIAYCVVTFLASEVSKRLYKCETCDKFDMAANKRRRFCDKACANKFTASKIDPKDRRDYREKRRSKGLE